MLRWSNPVLGAQGSGVFIGDLEGTPLIGAWTRFVLREASLALARLPLAERWQLPVNNVKGGFTSLPGAA
ncbi:hypothetical protein UB46_02190 [Burkholderiaceae bacterium 16]|nr:hypothetical protein UB46_02190 [Burkholderiaceae bacterium 16]